jgi:AraC-like DNA-binding protein
LQRRLAEEDTSFATIVDEVRLEVAKQALADPTNSLAEIAFLVGFEEQSSFSRAFKRWTGMSPSEHRNLVA